jgi:glycoprotein-N-acetylgalactosamine 3-beta-galactosyltransferase
MENLKTFLAHKCPDSRVMYGKRLRYFSRPPYNDTFYGENIEQGFIQGGAGWLISKETVKLFVETQNKDPNFCVMKRGQLEDQEICNCFRKLNIFPGETRDDEWRERFLMDKFEQLFTWPSQDQYRYSLNPIRLVNIIFNFFDFT